MPGKFNKTLPQYNENMAGLAKPFQMTDAEALEQAKQKLLNLIGSPTQPTPNDQTGMNSQQGRMYDQAHANLAARYGNTEAIPQNYTQKSQALQQIIDNAGSQQAIQSARQQLNELNKNKPIQLDVDDLEEIK